MEESFKRERVRYKAVRWTGDNLEEMRELFPEPDFALELTCRHEPNRLFVTGRYHEAFSIPCGAWWVWVVMPQSGTWIADDEYRRDYELVAAQPEPAPISHRYKRRVIQTQD